MPFLRNKVGQRMSICNLEHHFPATSTVCKCSRGSSTSLQADQIGTRISIPGLDRPFPATPPMHKPSRVSCTSLYGDKAKARISIPGLDRPFPATPPMHKPSRVSCTSLYGDKAKARISIPGLDRPFPATPLMHKPSRVSCTSLYGDKAKARISIPGLDRPFPATPPMHKPSRGSCTSLYRDKARAGISIPGLDPPFPATPPMHKPSRGSCTSLYRDKARAGISIPGLDRPFPATPPMHKHSRVSCTSLYGDKARTRTSISDLDCPFPVPSPMCKPCKESSIGFHEEKAGIRISIHDLDCHSLPATSPGCKLYRGSCMALHGDKVGTKISFRSLDCPFLGSSAVCKESQGILRKTSCDITYERIENIPRSDDCREHFLPCTDAMLDRTSQKPPTPTNRCSPMLNRRQNVAGLDTSGNTGRNRIERLQGENMKNIEHFPTCNKSLVISKAREHCAFPSSGSKTLMTNESNGFPMIDMTLGEKRTKYPPPIVSEPRDPRLSGNNTKLLCELKLNLENTEGSQSDPHLTDCSLVSRNLKSKPTLSYNHGICTWQMAASQVLHVRSDNTGISRQQMQQPCVPMCGLWKDQDESFLPAVKRTHPPEHKPEELGGGDARLGPSLPRRRSHAARDEMPKDMCGKKSSPVQSQREQLPAESHFRKRVKHFLQWIWPSRKCDGKNSFLEQASSSPSIQSMGLSSNQVAFTGNAEAQVKTPGGKIPGCKQGHDHGICKTCHQKLLSTHANFSKTQHNAELQTGAVPVQGCPFNHRATSCKATSTTSCCQGAAFVGQNYPTKNAHVRPRDRGPPKTVSFKDQLCCQKHPSGVCHRQQVPHPGPPGF
ncbi:spermatogenesis-associated protein 31D1-like isoform X2 [Ochotona princeps]|uniref:spermatogenesis-associated protein 31D1-like isoform X2 n=1 Tax=Ochotona princeps TaxID=9978 RepID=UPI002714E7EF|nr:spermatogenesis-associated protein 31D1-like isoform X2 [Ochotona princeps]